MNGYSILIWDRHSQGLNMHNPRLLQMGVDAFGLPQYWCQFNATDEEIEEGHSLKNLHYRVIRW